MLEPYHQTGRLRKNMESGKDENFEEFLSIYDVEIERVKKELAIKEGEKIGIEVPEGMRKFETQLKIFLEFELKASIVISSAACFGACDIKFHQFQVVGVNKIVHFGNVQIPNRKLPEWSKVVFVPLYVKKDAYTVLLKSIKYLKKHNIKRVGLASSIQYIKNLKQIKEKLEKHGMEVNIGIGDGRVAFHGQVLGCNASSCVNVKDKVDAFVMFENGIFHAKPISLLTHKNVYCFDIFTEQTFVFNYGDILKTVVKQRELSIEKLRMFNELSNVVILLSSKPGQARLNKLEEIQRIYEDVGFNVSIIILDYVNIDSINNIDADLIISTVCPRVVLEERNLFGIPIVSVTEAMEYIKNKKFPKGQFVFDQVS